MKCQLLSKDADLLDRDRFLLGLDEVGRLRPEAPQVARGVHRLQARHHLVESGVLVLSHQQRDSLVHLLQAKTPKFQGKVTTQE